MSIYKIDNTTFEIDLDCGNFTNNPENDHYYIKPLVAKKTLYLELDENLKQESKLTEGKKIYIPDYDQQPKIDSYIIEIDTRFEGKSYLKKG
jgi:hypothetical protein